MGAIELNTKPTVVPLGKGGRLVRYPAAFGVESWKLHGPIDDTAAQVIATNLLVANRVFGGLNHVILDWKEAVVETATAGGICQLAEQFGARCANPPRPSSPEELGFAVA